MNSKKHQHKKRKPKKFVVKFMKTKHKEKILGAHRRKRERERER